MLKFLWRRQCLPGETPHSDPGVRAEDHLPHAHHLHRPRLQPADLGQKSQQIFNIRHRELEPTSQINIIYNRFLRDFQKGKVKYLFSSKSWAF